MQTLIEDAKEHNIRILPFHLNNSNWDCELQEGSLRLGWRVLQGFQRHHISALMYERGRQPFASLGDFLERVLLPEPILYKMAVSEVFSCFGLSNTEALSQILEYLLSQKENSQQQLSLFNFDKFGRHLEGENLFSPAAMMRSFQTRHPMSLFKKYSSYQSGTNISKIRRELNGSRVSITGLLKEGIPGVVIGTDKSLGTIEDESGSIAVNASSFVIDKCREDLSVGTFFVIDGYIRRNRDSIALDMINLKVVDSGIEAKPRNEMWSASSHERVAWSI